MTIGILLLVLVSGAFAQFTPFWKSEYNFSDVRPTNVVYASFIGEQSRTIPDRSGSAAYVVGTGTGDSPDQIVVLRYDSSGKVTDKYLNPIPPGYRDVPKFVDRAVYSLAIAYDRIEIATGRSELRVLVWTVTRIWHFSMSAPSARGISIAGVVIVPDGEYGAPVVVGKRWMDDTDPAHYELVVAKGSRVTGGWEWQTTYRPEKGAAEGCQIIANKQLDPNNWVSPENFYVIGTAVTGKSGVLVKRPLLLKLRPAGQIEWTHTVDLPGDTSLEGRFIARVDSESVLLGVSSEADAPRGMMTLIKCARQDGAVQWISQAGEFAGPAEMKALDVTSTGPLVVTGYETNPASGRDFYTAAFDRVSGGLMWARRFDSGDSESGADDIALGARLDAEGNPVVLGISTPVNSDKPRVRLFKYAAQTGVVVWQRELAGSPGQTVSANGRQQFTVHRGMALVPLAATRTGGPSSWLVSPFRDGDRPLLASLKADASPSTDEFTVGASVTARHWATTCTWTSAPTESGLWTAPTIVKRVQLGPESVGTSVSATIPVQPHDTCWYEFVVRNQWGSTGTRKQFTVPNRLPVAAAKAVHASDVNREQLVFDAGADAADADRDDLLIEVISEPVNGSIRTDGKKVYFANPGFVGTQVVGLKVSDGYGGEIETQVTITNEAPRGATEVVEAFVGKPLSIDPLAGVSDPDGDTLEVVDLVLPTGGTIQREGSKLIYRAGANYSGGDTISYRLSDTRGGYLDRVLRIDLQRPLKRLLAASGEFVTGSEGSPEGIPIGARWIRFGVPTAIGSQAGWLGEIATSKGRYSGIFTGSTLAPRQHLITGESATDDSGKPVPGSRFVKLDEPVFAGTGTFALTARVWTGSRFARGLWWCDSVSLRRVLAIGEVAPCEEGGRIEGIDSFVIMDNGALVILGTVDGDRRDARKRRVLWTWNGSLREVLREGTKLPELSSKTIQRVDALRWSRDSPDERRFDSARGIVPVRLSFQDGTSAFVTLTVDGEVMTSELPADSRQIRITDVIPPSYEQPLPGSNQMVALMGEKQIVISGQEAPLVTVGDLLPGGEAGEMITKLSDPVANASADAPAVAFLVQTGGRLRGSAICWTRLDDRQLQTLIRTGDLAPDCNGARFEEFESLGMLPGGGPVFRARVGQSGLVRKGNEVGIWAADLQGHLRLVGREGDSIDSLGVKRIILRIEAFRNVRLSTAQGRALSSTTPQIVFRAVFTDGTSGIIQSTIP